MNAIAAGVPGARPSPAPAPIRLMIVDDSRVARAVLGRMLAPFPDLQVAAAASDAAEAIRLLGVTEVDVVLLDVEMPGASGLEALPEIVAAGRGARVLIVSSFCDRIAGSAAFAGPGMIESLAKPGAEAFSGRFSEVLADRLRRLGGRMNCAQTPAETPCEWRPADLSCLAIGASTGGLASVGALLQSLPRRLGVPILITQHLPAAFVPFFARHAEAASGRRVQIAREGIRLAADEVILAPGDAHLSLARDSDAVIVRLSDESVSGGCKPSVDVMLKAVAAQYGRGAVAVILSGMGRDGLAGTRAIAAAGGEVFAQDRESSAVWGMPRAVAEAGLAAAVLDPAGIGSRIAGRRETAAWK